MSVALQATAAPPRRFEAREVFLGYALVAAPLAVLVALVLMPAALAVFNSLIVVSGTESHFGLGRYYAFFSDAYSRANLYFTLVITTLSSLVAVLLSVGIAIYLRFGTGRVTAFIHAMSLFPLFVPSVIISFALMRFTGPNGLLQMMLERIGISGYQTPYLTPTGPFIAFVWESIPLPVLILTAALSQVPLHAVEAARDLGGSSFRIFCEILLPQIFRALVTSFVLVFLGTLGSYTVPYLLGPAAPEMMGPYMARTYTELQDPDGAEVQAVIVLAIAAVAGLFYLLASRKQDASA
jgi:putative spermidine/putrescine transport system permease protein